MTQHSKLFQIFADAFAEEEERLVISRRSEIILRGGGRSLADDLHGRSCKCYPCEQSNYRMDRDDPSAGGYEV
jgi:hypothetical protein